ncbi:MAG: hypothetical protein WCW78_00070 [Candidatus Paceibacterota bacterium]|jgi:hypothetical protein
MKKIVIVVGIIILSFFGTKHFEMSAKIAPLEEKFFTVADSFDGTKERAIYGPSVYKGQLDKIVNERNHLLQQFRYLKVGGWIVRGGRPEAVIICIYAGFLPQKWYDTIASYNM